MNNSFILFENKYDSTKNIDGVIDVMICHMLKFKYDIDNQSTSWITTIDRNISDLKNFRLRLGKNKYEKYFSKENYDKLYQKGIKKFFKETKKDEKLFKENLNDVISIDELKNINDYNILQFYNRYAIRDEIKNHLLKKNSGLIK